MKVSRRARSLADNYNLTERDWQKIWDFQKGRCAICKHLLNKANVDHCHYSGLIRGLLCSRCNRALGRFGDSIVLISAALSYLTNPPAIEALGEKRLGLPGRVGTKKRRKLIKKLKQG